jgi:hypothetical protein
MNLQESIRRILMESLESEWNEGNYDYQYGFCHYFAYNIIDKIRERFPNKKVNYYLLLANEVYRDTDEVEQDYLLHVYIKIGDKLLDSNGFTTMDEVEERVDDWYQRQLTMVPEEYDINVWEEESDEIPEVFFNNKFCNTKRVKEDINKFLSHPSVRKLLKDDLYESTTGDTPTTAINNKTPEKLVNREVKLKGDVNTTSKIKKINVNLDGSIKVDLQNGMKLNLSQRRLNDINFELYVPIEFIIKKKKNTLNESKKNKFASMEKSIANLVRMGLENYKLPENFHDVEVDITKSFGRLTCNVTFLFKRPFDIKDSDKMYVVGKEQIENIKDFYGKKFKITIGNSTINSYEDFRHVYDKEKEILDESEEKKGKYISSIMNLVNSFKNEDFVCDIDVYYYEDNYEVAVKIDKKEFEKKYENIDINYANILMTGYLDKLKRTIRQEIKDFFPVDVLVWFKKTNCNKSLNESEDKKSKLLSTIEEDGLFQIMQDTGLSMGQIILKYDNLPRKVFERYIKDFINADGYHMPGGDIQLGYSVELSEDRIAESFYMSGDKVTVELNEYGKYGMKTSESFERLENLSDEEIFTIVDDMSREWRM